MAIHTSQYRSDLHLVIRQEWLGNRRNLPTVARGELILGCEGFEKGRTIVLIDELNHTTTNFHGTTLYWPGADIYQVVWLRCYLAYLRDKGVVDWVGVGGSGGHMSPEYFDYLPIPKFPDDVQKSIAKLYDSPVPQPAESRSSTSIVEYHRTRNVDLGIWQLAREMNSLRAELLAVQQQIIQGRSAVVPVA